MCCAQHWPRRSEGCIPAWALGLHEATEIDPRSARYVNGNLADYLAPVNADVPG
jgi:xanthine dehydrogenase YagR molybdenum-binding subunit